MSNAEIFGELILEATDESTRVSIINEQDAIGISSAVKYDFNFNLIKSLEINSSNVLETVIPKGGSPNIEWSSDGLDTINVSGIFLVSDIPQSQPFVDVTKKRNKFDYQKYERFILIGANRQLLQDATGFKVETQIPEEVYYVSGALQQKNLLKNFLNSNGLGKTLKQGEPNLQNQPTDEFIPQEELSVFKNLIKSKLIFKVKNGYLNTYGIYEVIFAEDSTIKIEEGSPNTIEYTFKLYGVNNINYI